MLVDGSDKLGVSLRGSTCTQGQSYFSGQWHEKNAVVRSLTIATLVRIKDEHNGAIHDSTGSKRNPAIMDRGDDLKPDLSTIFIEGRSNGSTIFGSFVVELDLVVVVGGRLHTSKADYSC